MILLNSSSQLALLRRSRTVHGKAFTPVNRDRVVCDVRAEEASICVDHQFASEKMEAAGESNLIVVDIDDSLAGSAISEDGPAACIQGSFLVCHQLIYFKQV